MRLFIHLEPCTLVKIRKWQGTPDMSTPTYDQVEQNFLRILIEKMLDSRLFISFIMKKWTNTSVCSCSKPGYIATICSKKRTAESRSSLKVNYKTDHPNWIQEEQNYFYWNGHYFWSVVVANTIFTTLSQQVFICNIVNRTWRLNPINIYVQAWSNAKWQYSSSSIWLMVCWDLQIKHPLPWGSHLLGKGVVLSGLKSQSWTYGPGSWSRAKTIHRVRP